MNLEKERLKEKLMAEAFVVDTKDHRRAPFVLNEPQKFIRNTRGPWNIEVKPRQIGSTTYWTLDYFLDILIYSPMYMAIVSHEEEATQRLLQKIRVVYDNFPDWFKPRIKHDSAHEMSFPEIGSAVYIGTAGSRSFGRGDTFGRVILSEYAHWTEDRAKVIRVGIQEGAKSGNIAIESTPYGEGNQFHSLYLEAKAGKSPYTPIFIPWTQMPEYRYPPDHPFMRSYELKHIIPTDEEKVLGIDHDQIRFRRVTMQSMSSDPREARAIFLQEYPEDDISCFSSIAESVFSISAVSLLEKRDPLVTEDGIAWWQKPLEGRVYLIGADCATGYGKDKSVGVGLDITDYPKVTHIASVSGKYRDDEFAGILSRFGKALGNVELVVESNDVGQSVLNSLMNYMHYPRIFHQKNAVTGELEKRPGILTTAPMKRMLVEEGKKVINSGYLVTMDETLIKELKFFKSFPDGTIGASPGMNDDFVMALLLGLQGATRKPLKTGAPKSRPYGPQW